MISFVLADFSLSSWAYWCAFIRPPTYSLMIPSILFNCFQCLYNENCQLILFTSYSHRNFYLVQRYLYVYCHGFNPSLSVFLLIYYAKTRQTNGYSINNIRQQVFFLNRQLVGSLIPKIGFFEAKSRLVLLKHHNLLIFSKSYNFFNYGNGSFALS